MKNSAFCFSCHLFGKLRSNKDTLVHSSFSTWKRALEAFNKCSTQGQNDVLEKLYNLWSKFKLQVWDK